MSDEPLVPDVADAIVGYRAWRLHADGGLYGANDQLWTPRGKTVARCVPYNYHSYSRYDRAEPCAEPCADVPSPPAADAHTHGHGCGIYAYKARDLPEDIEATDDEGQVVAERERSVHGEVRLWGKVYEYDEGFRAQFAEIACIYDNGWNAQRAAETYGVDLVPWPVESVEERVARLQGYAAKAEEAHEKRLAVQQADPSKGSTSPDVDPTVPLTSHGTPDDHGWVFLDVDMGDGYVLRRDRGEGPVVTMVEWAIIKDGAEIHRCRRRTKKFLETGTWNKIGDNFAMEESNGGPAYSAATKWLKRHRYKRDHPVRRYKTVSAALHAVCFASNLAIAVLLGFWFSLGVAFFFSAPLAVYEWRSRRG